MSKKKTARFPVRELKNMKRELINNLSDLPAIKNMRVFHRGENKIPTLSIKVVHWFTKHVEIVNVIHFKSSGHFRIFLEGTDPISFNSREHLKTFLFTYLSM